uniref:Squalene synthase R6 n=1 Tax=Phoma sp. (strain ATCC 20986 / MF5453) TaxID=1828523 RepID=MFR6_PHOSM|nr:RecName: Full=Squalene synthase R6; Short=SQS; Short=SS; AltName: Full=Squalestatin S1 biosynthesis cluster protein R6 [Phoma sp. MF5453]AMY15074.1 squalene synthase [Phoma sp. MF5453]
MVSARGILYYLSHPQELRPMIQWKVFHGLAHQRDEKNESPDVQACYYYLALTSRSFVAVCQQLDPELLMPICIFYLVLRGLDTIEDDMTLSTEVKEPLLRNFHTTIYDQSWTFHDSGPDEKDRELLVHFDCVAREFAKVKDEYKVIITDITKKMGNGMADFVVNGELTGVRKIEDYELYCHYVAGVVGEGLTRLFVEAKVAEPSLLENPKLIESMGQFLQQTNIIRDVREDHDEVRHFWPKEVWAKYADDFDQLVSPIPQNRQKALQCSSEMVLMALNRADDCLNYISGVREQSVFNFVAIPQSMAIATLELCFQNPAIFDKNIKITKGTACQLMMDSTQDMQHVCQAFRRHARRIQKKNNPKDPHFHDINAACNKIERFIDGRYPNLQDEQAKADTMYLVVLLLGILGVAAAVLMAKR